MRMTVLASGSKGNSTVIAGGRTRILVDAGLSCRELLRRMQLAGEDPAALDAILVTHEHVDHVTGLAVLARRLGIPVYFTEPTHRAWMRMLTPRTTMSYARWLDLMQQEKLTRAAALAARVPTYALAGGEARSEPARLEAIAAVSSEAAAVSSEAAAVSSEAAAVSSEAAEAGTLRSDDPHAALELPVDPDAEVDAEVDADLDAAAAEAEDCDPNSTPRTRQDPTYLPAVEYFRAGHSFAIGDLAICPFTIPHDAADPCGFVFESEGIRMALATDLGYIPPNVKSALRNVDVLFLESNHDLEMLRDGPYPWSVKQRVLSRVGHLSNDATAEFLERDYDGGAAYIVLGHLSESNNAPELARITAERAVGDRMNLLGNRILLALQSTPLEPIQL